MKLMAVLLVAMYSAVANATIRTLQVTLGAGATQVSTNQFVGCRWIAFQDNATHAMRLGDASVTASRGVQLIAGGGSFYQGVYPSPTSVNLASWYVYGTAGDVLDVVYDDGN